MISISLLCTHGDCSLVSYSHHFQYILELNSDSLCQARGHFCLCSKWPLCWDCLQPGWLVCQVHRHPTTEPSLERVSQGHIYLLPLEQPAFSLSPGKKTIQVVRIEGEVGDDQVKLFLILVEQREGQKEVAFLAWVMNQLCLFSSSAFILSHSYSPVSFSWGR